MRTFQQIAPLRTYLRGIRQEGKTIGFVPTMGALHAGHMSLVKRAAQDCDLVVVSIFVNPTQFGPTEDFTSYPRVLQQDLQVASNSGVDAVYTPAVEDIYPDGFQTTVTPGALAQRLEGQHRPGHFAGVCTVVAKLLNIVQPDRAFFGQKDFQQARIIEQMVHDLNFPYEVVVAPTVRADDGLALSSRNAYLSQEERLAATALNEALNEAARAHLAGEKSPQALSEIVRERCLKEPLVSLEYCEIANNISLEPIEDVDSCNAVILVAARVGKTRLIDNIVLPTRLS